MASKYEGRSVLEKGSFECSEEMLCRPRILGKKLLSSLTAPSRCNCSESNLQKVSFVYTKMTILKGACCSCFRISTVLLYFQRKYYVDVLRLLPYCGPSVLLKSLFLVVFLPGPWKVEFPAKNGCWQLFTN